MPCAVWADISQEIRPYEPAKAFQLFEKQQMPIFRLPSTTFLSYTAMEKELKRRGKADFWRMKAAQNGFRMAIDEIEKPAENQ